MYNKGMFNNGIYTFNVDLLTIIDEMGKLMFVIAYDFRWLDAIGRIRSTFRHIIGLLDLRNSRANLPVRCENCSLSNRTD